MSIKPQASSTNKKPKRTRTSAAKSVAIKGQPSARKIKRVSKRHASDDTLADDIALDGFDLARGLHDLLR